MNETRPVALALLLALGVSAWGSEPRPPLAPSVEAEEDVYTYEPADNGAGPLWCNGSTCLVRTDSRLFASGLETIPGCPPLNNCRWTLFERQTNGWQQVDSDPADRTREPSPLVAFPDGRFFLSANPTLRTNRTAGGGPAEPRILEFSVNDARSPTQTLLPKWEGTPAFAEHSYRSFAADGPNRELILFQNIGYTHAEWSFLDRDGHWSAQGKLVWPWGSEYDKPEPIRVCYPTVALQDRAVYFCGVSDVLEPYQPWREFKKQITGREWDYDFRRLFYTWTPDIRSGKFHPWIEVASRDATCGWISPADLYVGGDGAVHLLWAERALDERLREKFYPQARQSHSLQYAVVREGEVVLRRTLVEAREGESRVLPSWGRFQITSDERLIVVYYAHGSDATGKAVSENRLLEIRNDGNATAPMIVPLRVPFTGGFTATVRAGSPRSDTLEILGEAAGKPKTLRYARIRLW